MKVAVLMGVAALAFAGSAAAETWHAFSRSASNAFMAEVEGIMTAGEITSIRTAASSLTCSARNTKAASRC